MTLFAKKQGEVINVTFNFLSQLRMGETLSSAEIDVAPWAGDDYNPTDILSGSPSISGSVVTQKVDDGMAGVQYILTCRATSSTGNVYVTTQTVGVLSSTGYDRRAVPALTGTLPAGSVGVPYSNVLTISGGYAPYEAVEFITGAPPWMSFEVSGDELVCSGTPDEDEVTNYSFTPAILDSAGQEATCPQTMEVNPLSITGDLVDGMVHLPAEGQYTAHDGPAPYVFSVLSGTFPAGVTLNSDGTWSGRFTTAGSYSWVVQATDAIGQVATLPDTCVVDEFVLEFGASVGFGFPTALIQGEGDTSLIGAINTGGIVTSAYVEGAAPSFVSKASSSGYGRVAYSPPLNTMALTSGSETSTVGVNLAYSVNNGGINVGTNGGPVEDAAGLAVAWIPELEIFAGISVYDRYSTSNSGSIWSTNVASGTWPDPLVAPQHLEWIPSIGKFVAWRADVSTAVTSSICTAPNIQGPWTSCGVSTNSYVWVDWCEDLGLAVVMSRSGTGYWTNDFVTFTPITISSEITSLPNYTALYAPCWSPDYQMYIARIRQGVDSWRIAASFDGKNWILVSSTGIPLGTDPLFTLPLWDVDGARYVWLTPAEVFYSTRIG